MSNTAKPTVHNTRSLANAAAEKARSLATRTAEQAAQGHKTASRLVVKREAIAKMLEARARALATSDHTTDPETATPSRAV